MKGSRMQLLQLLFFSFGKSRSSKALLKTKRHFRYSLWGQIRLFLVALFFIPATMFAAATETFTDDLYYGDLPLSGSVTKNAKDLYTLTVKESGYVYVTVTDTEGLVLFSASTESMPTTEITDFYGPVPYFSGDIGDPLYISVSSPGVTAETSYEMHVYLIEPYDPSMSILPSTKNIDDEATSVELNIVTTVCPFEYDVNVTYVNEANTSDTGTVTFNAGICALSQPITVNVPSGYGIGDTFDVNISCDDTDVCSVIDFASLSSITILDAVSDMSITKTAPGAVGLNATFDYNITVTNIGNSAAIDVNITDSLDAALTYNSMSYDVSAWNCSESGQDILCTYSGDFAVGETSSIILNVTAPATKSTISNTALVESGNDTDLLNNSSIANTQVVDFTDPTDLCYFNSSGEKIANNGSDCLIQGEGNSTFYYGDNCHTSVRVGNVNPLAIVYDVVVEKLYSPSIDTGTCGPDDDCFRHLLTSDVPGYGLGYSYDQLLLNPFKNITIYDENSYNSTTPVTDIALYVTYVKHGYTYSGELSPCTAAFPLGDEDTTIGKMDIVDTLFDSSTYNNGAGSVLTTKIVGGVMTVDIVYLGDNADGSPEVFKGLPFAAILELAENDGSGNYNIITPLYDTSEPKRLLVAELIAPNASGVISATSAEFAIPEAHRDVKIVARYDDITGELATNLAQCIKRSATTGNLQDIAACLNSEDKLEDAYVRTASACLNTWIASNGQPYGPCSSNAGNAGFPLIPPYDAEPACLSCLIGPTISAFSKDNFAVRPDKYDVPALNGAAVIVKAKEPTALTFLAVNADGATPTTLYSEDQTVSFNVDFNITDVTKVCDFSTFDMSPQVHFVDGSNSNDFTFDHVGVFEMKVSEIDGSEYALVDADDTVDDQRFISPWTLDVTITPDYFELNTTYHDANKNKNFTYLSDGADGFNMMSMLEISLDAKGFDNLTTPNYDKDCYAQDIDIDISHSTVTSPNLTEIVMRAQSKYGGVANVDQNVTKGSNISFTTANGYPLLKDFFLSGVADIELLINFNRKTDKPLNPFKFTLIDMTVADENGTTTDDTLPQPQVLDQNATFFYARVHSPRNRAMCPTASGSCGGNVNFFYEIYAKNATTVQRGLITTLLGTSPKKSLDSVNWYRNLEHNLSSDGNVTSSSYNTMTTPITISPVNYTVNTALVATTAAYTYSGTRGYPYKTTVTVDSSLNDTQAWLIYDPLNPHPVVANRAELEFYGPGEWSSDTGAAESVDDAGSEKNRNTNRRIRW